MKKKTLIIVVLVFLSAGALFASTRIFGAGASIAGDSRSLSSMDANITLVPFSFNAMNPFLRLETGVEFGKNTFRYSGLRAGLGFEVFRTRRNPFAFTQNNPGLWAPSVFTALNTDFDRILLNIEVSPVRVLDKDFVYEWFGLFWNLDSKGLSNWGVRLFRFTALF